MRGFRKATYDLTLTEREALAVLRALRNQGDMNGHAVRVLDVLETIIPEMSSGAYSPPDV